MVDSERGGLGARCHRVGKGGARIGPDLTGVGRRFSRIHLIEAVLEPSRAIAPSYQTRVVVLESGRVVTGVRVTETPTELTLGDEASAAAAKQAAEVAGPRVSVVPSRSVPQGIAALLAFNPELDDAANVAAMRSALAGVQAGDGTPATRPTTTHGVAGRAGRVAGPAWSRDRGGRVHRQSHRRPPPRPRR